MTIQTQNEVVALQRIGRIVSLILQQMLDAAAPGMTTLELDRLGERLLDQHGAKSAPRLTYNFPGATCISINEQAAHGIPGVASRSLRISPATELAAMIITKGAPIVVTQH